MQVWVDVDELVAPVVRAANRVPGLRTLASHQGPPGDPRAYLKLGYTVTRLPELAVDVNDDREVRITDAFWERLQTHLKLWLPSHAYELGMQGWTWDLRWNPQYMPAVRTAFAKLAEAEQLYRRAFDIDPAAGHTPV